MVYGGEVEAQPQTEGVIATLKLIEWSDNEVEIIPQGKVPVEC